MHLYLRERETGRFITHFNVEDKDWMQWELAAKALGLNMEDFISHALREQLDKALTGDSGQPAPEYSGGA